MRRIIATAFVSLDGVMQAPGGQGEDPSGGFKRGGWAATYSDHISGGAVLKLVGSLAKPNDILLGRKTFDIWCSFWPHAPATDPIGPVLNKANKYVMTSGTDTSRWANSHELHRVDDLKKVKSGEGPDIVLWGSSTLYPQLMEANLIDRLVLMTFPVMLGGGKKLFGDTTHSLSMKLLASEVNSTGVIIATYESPAVEAPKFWNQRA